MLEVAAVAGRFTIADLVRAAGVTRAVVAAALDRGTARRAGGRGRRPGQFTFAHAIVRDAVHEALTEARRGELHEAVASALRVRRDAGADVAAAQISRTTRWPPRAPAPTRSRPGRPRSTPRARPRCSLGHAEAAAHYAEALEALALGAEAPAAERRATLLDLADATFSAGDIEPPAGATRRPPTPRAATATRTRSPARRSGSRRCAPTAPSTQESVALLSHALERLRRRCAARARSPACWRCFEPDQARREALIDEALRDARRLGDEAHARLAVSGGGGRQLARRAGRAARRGGRADRPHAPPTTPTTARSCGRTCTGSATRCRPATSRGADADLDRARPVAHATRRSVHRWFLMVAESGRATFAGRLDEASRMATEALALNRRHGEDC